MSRLEWFLVFLAVLCGFFLGLGIATASAQEAQCPPGHTIAAVYEGPAAYVYTPNLPAGYSRVITTNPDRVFDMPPPGTYWGDTITVCYTEDIIEWATHTHTAAPTTTSSTTPTQTPPRTTPTISVSTTQTAPAPTSTTPDPSTAPSRSYGGRLNQLM